MRIEMNTVLASLLALSVGAIIFLSSLDGFAMQKGEDLMSEKPEGYPEIVLAGGCFWCTEYEYRALNGVLYTRVGYMGGHIDNPTYQDITTGKSGHAEVIGITFDPEQVSKEQLFEYFLVKAHDPTTLNRQGVDKGTQYRSAIFYADAEEKALAQKVIAMVENLNVWDDPIVTTLEPLSTFWEGEEYHQQYYEKYKEQTGNTHIRVMVKEAKKLKN